MKLKLAHVRVPALLVLLGGPLAAAAHAATPTPEQALKLTPVQRDVEYDRPLPEDAAKCTIKAEKLLGKTGWVVRDAGGRILRCFLDTNGDNVVDQWSYFAAGLENYRDIDANFNGKADEARWLNAAGSRWGLDTNEDGQIDSWKAISAEEVTAEFVAAVRDRDAARFSRLLPSSKEATAMGLAPDRAQQLTKALSAAELSFKSAAARQKIVGGDSKWVSFGAIRPSFVPAGTAGSTADMLMYSNVTAMIDTKGESGHVAIGTLVRVNDAWRLIDVPEGEIRQEFTGDVPEPADTAGRPSDKVQSLMAELDKIDREAIKAPQPEQQAVLHARRADVLDNLIAESEPGEDRTQWQKQFADTVSAAVQAGTYPAGVERLRQLHDNLKQQAGQADLTGYVQYRLMTAEYTQSLQKPDVEYAKVQGKWLEDLEKFVAANPKCADCGDAYLQLAISQEFAGQEDKALKYYDQIVHDFPQSPAARKAVGAKTRLESVGKSITVRGKSPTGTAVDLASFKGKVVLIQYWASWAEPCKTDIAQLKDMLDKYGAKGFTILGVSLDNSKAELEAALAENRIRWPQIFEEGGLDGRLANELGILTVPTMILVDKQGRVLNRGIHAAELDRELRNLLK